MTPASRHDDADAEISMALQLSSSITLTLDSFTTSPLNIQPSTTSTDYLPVFTGCVRSCRIFDHPQNDVVYNFGRVCLSVCLTITFDSLDLQGSYSHIRYISRKCGSRSYMNVIGSKSRSQDCNKSRKSLFPQCKTSIDNNSGSIKHRAMNFTCSMRFLVIGGNAIFVT